MILKGVNVLNSECAVRSEVYNIMSTDNKKLILTKLRNAYRGQSRSPNIVPFHMLGIVSY